MRMVTKQADGTRRAVENMLFGCAGAEPGERLLVLEEPPDLGHYDNDLAPAIVEAAEGLGLHVLRHDIGFSPEPAEFADAVMAQMASADHILYLARLGDQMRFRPCPMQTSPSSAMPSRLPRLQAPSAPCRIPR